jgi:hypothetical protein
VEGPVAVGSFAEVPAGLVGSAVVASCLGLIVVAGHWGAGFLSLLGLVVFVLGFVAVVVGVFVFSYVFGGNELSSRRAHSR